MNNNKIFYGKMGWSGDDKFYSKSMGKDRTDYLKTVVEFRDGMKYTTHYIDRPVRQGDSVSGAISSLINGVETITEIIKYVYKAPEKVEFDCYNCVNSFMNPFDQYFCMKVGKNNKSYDIEKGKHCRGIHYVSKNRE